MCQDSRDRLGTLYRALLDRCERDNSTVVGPVRFIPKGEEQRPERFSVTLEDEDTDQRLSLDLNLNRGGGRGSVTHFRDQDAAGDEVASFALMLENDYRVDWDAGDDLPAGAPAMATSHGFFQFDSPEQMAERLYELVTAPLQGE